jgi:hypothetical protein
LLRTLREGFLVTFILVNAAALAAKFPASHPGQVSFNAASTVYRHVPPSAVSGFAHNSKRGYQGAEASGSDGSASVSGRLPPRFAGLHLLRPSGSGNAPETEQSYPLPNRKKRDFWMLRPNIQKSHSEQAPVASAQMLATHLCGSRDASFRDSLASSAELFNSPKNFFRAGRYLHFMALIRSLAFPLSRRQKQFPILRVIHN